MVLWTAGYDFWPCFSTCRYSVSLMNDCPAAANQHSWVSSRVGKAPSFRSLEVVLECEGWVALSDDVADVVWWS